MTARPFASFVLAGAVASFLAIAPTTARADEPSSQGYQTEPVQSGYVAPLSQTTQPTYVPQSVALSGPREIKDYQEGDPIPPGYRPVERVRKGLIIGGAVTFGSIYLINALVAAAASDAGDGNELAALWVPAIGPFIQMANTSSAVGNVFLALDGIAQSAGLAMLIVGIASPKTILVRNDLGEIKPTIRPMPLVGQGMSGAGIVGTF